MAEVIRDVIVRYKLEAVDSKIMVPDVKPGIKAIEQVEKKVEQTTKSKIKNEKKVEAQVEKTTKAVVKQKKAVEDFGKVSKEQGRKAEEHFGKAAEGALQLSRGIALLGIAGEEDTAKLVRGIIQIQGGFDAIKGGISVYKQLNAGITAAAAANTLLAGSNTSVAVTGVAATVSMAPLLPILIPLAAAAAAVGIAYLAMKDNSPEKSIDRTTGALRRQTIELAKQIDLENELADITRSKFNQQAAIGRAARGELDTGPRFRAIGQAQISVTNRGKRTAAALEEQENVQPGRGTLDVLRAQRAVGGGKVKLRGKKKEQVESALRAGIAARKRELSLLQTQQEEIRESTDLRREERDTRQDRRDDAFKADAGQLQTSALTSSGVAASGFSPLAIAISQAKAAADIAELQKDVARKAEMSNEEIKKALEENVQLHQRNIDATAAARARMEEMQQRLDEVTEVDR